MLAETRPAKVGKWTEPALRVLRERYLARDGGEVVETPEEMCWRVALSIAAGEARYGRSQAAVREIATAFYEVMVDGGFLPNSPTLMNAGKGNGLQYSACYVLPVGDSMEEIFDSVKAAAIIHKCLVGDTLVMSAGFWLGGDTKLPEFTLSAKPGRNRTSFVAKKYRLPRELTPELAELIGLYIGDGSNHRDGIRFTVGSDCPEVVERIKTVSHRLFGKTPTISAYRDARAVEVALLSRQIKEWFRSLGVTKASAREARVPE